MSLQQEDRHCVFLFLKKVTHQQTTANHSINHLTEKKVSEIQECIIHYSPIITPKVLDTDETLCCLFSYHWDKFGSARFLQASFLPFSTSSFNILKHVAVTLKKKMIFLRWATKKKKLNAIKAKIWFFGFGPQTPSFLCEVCIYYSCCSEFTQHTLVSSHLPKTCKCI